MTEKKEKIMLKWNSDHGQFSPIESDTDMKYGIFIELLEEEEKWRYFYIKGASLIDRRTALRAANGISKAGFLHPERNRRYGVECNLEEEVSPYEDMPDNLKKTQRFWYKGEYKEY
ncbi:hypothetical protein LCGC14_2096300 [marine sediment metagenome]|uniref:Uncharacterized protein n=1 Tax=marine sediment metagenome TaxID=412755 RepID=A0A0F9EBA1_9ZZZZ